MTLSTMDPTSTEARPAERPPVAFLLLDGLRRPRTARSEEAVLCALGLGADGSTYPLALRVVAREDEQAWGALLRSLKVYGIERDLLLVCCDDHPALVKAAQATFPDTPIQISVAHRLLALARKVDAGVRAACLADAREIFTAPDAEAAVARFRTWRAGWFKQGPRAVSSLESDLASCLTFYRFPQHLWVKIRTVNLVERAYREARRSAPPASQREALDDTPDTPGAPDERIAQTATAGETRLTEPVTCERTPSSLSSQSLEPAGHVLDLCRDADFMWWLKQHRQHAHARSIRISMAAMVVLTGLMTGLALTKLL